MKTILSTEILNQAIYLLVAPITAVKSQQNEKSYLQSNQLFADLGEASSLVTQTCMVEKIKTKYLERETAAFMAPEIMIEECMLQTAGIEDLKRTEPPLLHSLFY